MKKFIYVLSLFLLLFFFKCLQEVNKNDTNNVTENHSAKSDSILVDALKNLSSKNTVDKLEVSRKILQSDTTQSLNFIRYGMQLILNNNKKEGLSKINKAIDINPKNGFAYFIKGMMITLVYPESRDSVYFYCNKAIELEPKNLYYIVVRAQLYNEDSFYGNSIRDYNLALSLKPNNPDLKILRGIVYYNASEYNKALADLEVIPESRKKDLNIYSAKAHSFLLTNKFEEAIKVSNTILAMDSLYAFAYAIRGVAKSHKDDLEGAYKDLEKGAKLGDKDCQEQLDKIKEHRKKNKEI